MIAKLLLLCIMQWWNYFLFYWAVFCRFNSWYSPSTKTHTNLSVCLRKQISPAKNITLQLPSLLWHQGATHKSGFLEAFACLAQDFKCVRQLPLSWSSAPPPRGSPAALPQRPSPHPASYWFCSSSPARRSSSTKPPWWWRERTGNVTTKFIIE